MSHTTFAILDVVVTILLVTIAWLRGRRQRAAGMQDLLFKVWHRDLERRGETYPSMAIRDAIRLYKREQKEEWEEHVAKAQASLREARR